MSEEENFDWQDNKQWNNNEDKPDMRDFVEMVKLDNDWSLLRMVGEPSVNWVHWIKTKGKNKVNSFKKDCLGFNPKTGKVVSEDCPYCQLGLKPAKEIHANVIDREEQENEPKKKRKAKGSEAKPQKWKGQKHFVKAGKDEGVWTPVRVLRITNTMGRAISELASLNKAKTKDGEKGSFNPNHPQHGFDINVKYDKNAQPANMYSIQKDEKNSLSKEERSYHIWAIPGSNPETLEQAEEQVKRIKPHLCDYDGELIFPGEDESDKKSKKKKGKTKEYKDEFDVDDDEDLEEGKSKKNSKKDKKKTKKEKKKSKKSDDDEDDFDDEDEEDEKSKKKSKKSKKDKKTTKKSKKSDDDEDDDEDDFDVDEDEEDEPKKSKKDKKTTKKSKKKSDDEDDDDFDEDDEEEEKSKKKSKKSTKKSKKSDDEDDEDEDEDSKKSKKKTKKSTKKSKKSDDEDEDWDGDDEEDDWDEDD